MLIRVGLLVLVLLWTGVCCFDHHDDGPGGGDPPCVGCDDESGDETT